MSHTVLELVVCWKSCLWIYMSHTWLAEQSRSHLEKQEIFLHSAFCMGNLPLISALICELNYRSRLKLQHSPSYCQFSVPFKNRQCSRVFLDFSCLARSALLLLSITTVNIMSNNYHHNGFFATPLEGGFQRKFPHLFLASRHTSLGKIIFHSR